MIDIGVSMVSRGLFWSGATLAITGLGSAALGYALSGRSESDVSKVDGYDELDHILSKITWGSWLSFAGMSSGIAVRLTQHRVLLLIPVLLNAGSVYKVTSSYKEANTLWKATREMQGLA